MNAIPNDALRRLLCARQSVLEKALEMLQPEQPADARSVKLPTEASERLAIVANEITGELQLLRAVLQRVEDGRLIRCTELSDDIEEARLQAYACSLLFEAGIAPADCELDDADCISRVDEKIGEWQRSLRSA